MIVVDSKTGKKANYSSKDTLIEVFKSKSLTKNSFEDSQNLNYKLSKSNIFNFY